ncbi:glycosyltransferase family 2 protein [Ramlibacter sp. AW1]|uniref:Glycosyltransferase family 2 protein n=1 Tax=Ramlibacter aurantiacus TaxID=2801330 RepID=A0A936ZJ82_9BURK|nr:glycosyltransferase family 2 protein [Ramlibacter aurantiacus]MBL0421213.1 glycosyltransferase family 2 protein [Ramlibacter aurantiacus]
MQILQAPNADAARSALGAGVACPDPLDASGELELTILMPCLNEANTVGRCVQMARAFLAASDITGEVLVVDNGSSDGSAERATAAGARVVRAEIRGYGAALTEGIRQAQGRYVVMGDADDSYDFASLAPFVAQLRQGAQLVMGNRFRGGIAPGAMPLTHRYLGNPVLSFLGRVFFRISIGDFHCGLRGFDRRAIQQLALTTTGMEFASEMVAKAALARLRIAEVPASLRPDGRGRPPHLRTWRDGWRHLLFMLLYSPRWLFLIPGALLLLSGAAGFGLAATGPWHLGPVSFGIHSLLYMAAAVILGLQFIQLAFLTKWAGVVTGIVPSPPWLERVARRARVEFGLVLGLGLALAGLVWSARLVSAWGAGGFGALDPTEVMRQAIPAVTLMVVGVQAIAGSLFAGALHFAFRSLARRPGHE